MDDDDLFAHARSRDPRFAPLAERMRPRSLKEYVGQTHLTGEGRLLRRALDRDRIPNMILWGPPGTGKTTLARIIARHSDSFFATLSATDAGIKDLRRVVSQARERRNMEGRSTLFFIDEIHRFNKVQQDALLPHVEAGVCTLIGATTENPSFEVNAALLSRARVVQLRPLGVNELAQLLRAAVEDSERGLGDRRLQVEERLLRGLAIASQGDARRALNTLELAAELVPDGAGEHAQLLAAHVSEALGGGRLRYDRDGEEHHNIVSALIKSMRASDPDAAVYWMARMLEAGERLEFVARRLLVFAAEDVGNADPQALLLAQAAAQAARFVGLPEAVLPLTQAAIYLSLAPKSNNTIKAYSAARKDVRQRGALPVPLELRNPVTELMKQSGYGHGYHSPHDLKDPIDPEHGSYLPEALRGHLPGRRYVREGTQGWEARAEARLARARGASPDPERAPQAEPDLRTDET